MPLEAIDLIPSPPALSSLPPINILFGSDPFLRTWAAQVLTTDVDAETLDGGALSWRDLHDEISTASLFDMGERRIVIVREADGLVKEYRKELEDYVAKPSSASRVLFEIQTLASNTRLYKAAEKDQLIVHCGVPVIPSRKKEKDPDLKKLYKFLRETVASKHQCKLTEGAAAAMVELIGLDIGMLDTEIAKVALYDKPGATINEDRVREIVGGWKALSIWGTIDAVAKGDAAEAIRQLDRMMNSGQEPIALLPQIAWSLRRFGLATSAIEYAEKTTGSRDLQNSLRAAGVFEFQLQEAEQQMKALGRPRCRQLLSWLLEADLKLKGSHSHPGLNRWALEELVMRLAKTS